jgi:hypothetical protein
MLPASSVLLMSLLALMKWWSMVQKLACTMRHSRQSFSHSMHNSFTAKLSEHVALQISRETHVGATPATKACPG